MEQHCVKCAIRKQKVMDIINTQRAIKFRAWDKLEKRFTYPDKGYQGHYVLTLNGQFQNLQNGSGGDEYVVQQFTGLKDYESNDIYEGDIVRYELDGIVYTQTVEWGNNGWEMIDTRLYSTPLITNLPNFEVIGNIFEHPELLNK
jgi:uncharacterized phage protein (TIGR01671 family)